MMSDPYDRAGINEYVNKFDERESRDVDLPFGYQNRIKREKEQHPELYEAWKGRDVDRDL